MPMSTPTDPASRWTERTRNSTTIASKPQKKKLAIAGEIVMSRSSGSASTCRAPSAISRRSRRSGAGRLRLGRADARATRSARRGSSPRRRSARTGARSTCTSAPPRPGPATWATAWVPCSFAFPSARSAGRHEDRQVRLIGDLEQHRRDARRRPPRRTAGRTCSVPSRGHDRNAGDRAARTRSQPIISRRLRDRSTQTPAGRPINSHGAHCSRGERTHREAARVQIHDGDQRQHDETDRRADLADRLPAPEQHEVPVPPESPAAVHCDGTTGRLPPAVSSATCQSTARSWAAFGSSSSGHGQVHRTLGQPGQITQQVGEPVQVRRRPLGGADLDVDRQDRLGQRHPPTSTRSKDS